MIVAFHEYEEPVAVGAASLPLLLVVARARIGRLVRRMRRR